MVQVAHLPTLKRAFYTGFIDDDTIDRYTISLGEGQGVIITAEAASGSDLDTYLILEDVNWS